MIFEGVYISPETLFSEPSVLSAAHGLAGAIFIRTFGSEDEPPVLFDINEPTLMSSHREKPTNEPSKSYRLFYHFEQETVITFRLWVRFEALGISLDYEFEFTANVYHWSGDGGSQQCTYKPWGKLSTVRFR